MRSRIAASADSGRRRALGIVLGSVSAAHQSLQLSSRASTDAMPVAGFRFHRPRAGCGVSLPPTPCRLRGFASTDAVPVAGFRFHRPRVGGASIGQLQPCKPSSTIPDQSRSDRPPLTLRQWRLDCLAKNEFLNRSYHRPGSLKGFALSLPSYCSTEQSRRTHSWRHAMSKSWSL